MFLYYFATIHQEERLVVFYVIFLLLIWRASVCALGTINAGQIYPRLSLVVARHLRGQVMDHGSVTSHLILTPTFKGCRRGFGRSVQNSRCFDRLLRDLHGREVLGIPLLHCRCDYRRSVVQDTEVRLHHRNEHLDHSRLRVMTETHRSYQLRLTLDLQRDIIRVSPKNASRSLREKGKWMKSWMKMIFGGEYLVYVGIIEILEPHHRCDSNQICLDLLRYRSFVACDLCHYCHLMFSDLHLWLLHLRNT